MNVRSPDAAAIAEGARLLRAGKLVVFPTETVYGVGANALDEKAVAGIFAAKGRPADNPVILHVSDVAMAKRLVRSWSPAADTLARKFWPGPLTLVLPKTSGVPTVATGGLDTVAIRCPDHPVARQLIAAAGVPIAAPSANRSGLPSPTRCNDAVADLGDRVALYLDGGPTRIGVESTVIGLAGAPTLLRAGGIPREAIEKEIGPLAVAGKSDRPQAPGMKYRHYSPETPLRIVTAAQLREQHASSTGPDIAWVVASESNLSGRNVTVVASRHAADVWAHRLFSLLRDLDTQGFREIVVEEIPETGIGAAVMERLRKAAGR